MRLPKSLPPLPRFPALTEEEEKSLGPYVPTEVIAGQRAVPRTGGELPVNLALFLVHRRPSCQQ